MFARGEGVQWGGGGKKGEGEYIFQLQNKSHENVIDSTENIVYNIIITLYSNR